MNFGYELMLNDDGSAVLTQGGDVMWTSDGDDDFYEEFPDEVLEADDLHDVVSWLKDNGYVPPGVDVELVDEDGDRILDAPPEDDEDDDYEDEDEDEDEEEWQ